jgi:hypothetical protein
MSKIPYHSLAQAAILFLAQADVLGGVDVVESINLRSNKGEPE